MDHVDPETLDALGVPVFVARLLPDRPPVLETLNSACQALCPGPVGGDAPASPRSVFGTEGGDALCHGLDRLRDHGAPLVMDTRVRSQHGERPVRAVLEPLTGGRPVRRAIGTLTDLTGLPLAPAGTPTREVGSTEDREHFIAMAAHDLRAPMRQVQQIAEMLKTCSPDDESERAELLDMLEELGMRTSDLVVDVLTYAQTRICTPTSQSIELGQLCADIFQMLDPLGFHALQSQFHRIEVDSTALQIVLRNLIENAIKHAGRARVSVSVEVVSAVGGVLEFIVRDNGSGVDDTLLRFLSDGIHQRSLGFGLMGVRQLLASRGGEIWAARPENGIGSEIHFLLPGQMLQLDLPARQQLARLGMTGVEMQDVDAVSDRIELR